MKLPFVTTPHMLSSSLQDRLHLISRLTLPKIWNAGKMLLSYHLARLLKKTYLPALPISLSIEPTTSCNLRCPECPSGLRSFTRPTGMLQQGLFQRVIEELAPTLNYLTLYFQGEPYLHRQLFDMVKYASARNIYTATSTNAHYLDDERAKKTIQSGLDRLIISIDGTNQETYAAYRIGGRLNKVIEGTKNIVKWKKRLNSSTPHVVFQCLVVRPNENQVEGIYTLARRLGVDEVKLKTAQIYNYQNGSNLMPRSSRYSRYKKLADGTYTIKNKWHNHCWKMWHSCVITWDGKVVPCCFDKDAQFVLGNLKTHTFEQIWQHREYHAFRTSLLQSRDKINMCKNCTEGTKVWAQVT